MTKKLLNPTYGFDFSKFYLKRKSHLVIIDHIYNEAYKRPKRRLIAQCDCGNITHIQVQVWTKGSVTSCGCLVKKLMKFVGKKNIKHGHANSVNNKENTRIYTSWAKIRGCCFAGWRKGFHKVCHEYDPRWDNFIEFLKDFGNIKENETISRLDNQMPWSKENCYIRVLY